MLAVESNEYNWDSSNIGSTFTDAGMGTSVAASGSANTKGTTTSLLTAIAEDCYWIEIWFTGGSASGVSRRFLADLYVDPAGGTAWESTPRIANLAANAPAIIQGGVKYAFPLFIKTGSSIGMAVQSATASATVRCGIRVLGKPSRPEMLKTGQRVVTYGATAASTTGTAFTPGASGAKGSYASLAVLTETNFFWQLGVLINDTTQTAVQYFVDLALGDASNKKLAIQDKPHTNASTAEQAGACGDGMGTPWRKAVSGDSTYVRGACTGIADTNVSAIAYGVVG